MAHRGAKLERVDERHRLFFADQRRAQLGKRRPTVRSRTNGLIATAASQLNVATCEFLSASWVNFSTRYSAPKATPSGPAGNSSNSPLTRASAVVSVDFAWPPAVPNKPAASIAPGACSRAARLIAPLVTAAARSVESTTFGFV